MGSESTYRFLLREFCPRPSDYYYETDEEDWSWLDMMKYSQMGIDQKGNGMARAQVWLVRTQDEETEMVMIWEYPKP